MHCGVSVDENEVPPNDPSRNERMMIVLKRKREPSTETINQMNSEKSGFGHAYADLPTKKLEEQNGKNNNHEKKRSQLESEENSSTNPDHVSRFYVRKRIIVGNTSKHIRSNSEGDQATHKWMVNLT